MQELQRTNVSPRHSATLMTSSFSSLLSYDAGGIMSEIVIHEYPYPLVLMNEVRILVI